MGFSWLPFTGTMAIAPDSRAIALAKISIERLSRVDNASFTPPPASQTQDRDRDQTWAFWPVVPLYPYGNCRTLRREVVKDTIWTFEQVQGILYVIVPIRMTVVKLDAGGLLVYAPIAPTPECVRLVRELEIEHGEVKYIILPTVSGLEHKVFVGPFARKFRHAQVYVAPQQWSFPVSLPLSWLGFPVRRTHILPNHFKDAPFGDEFSYSILGPIYLGPGKFGEVVMLHRRSHTLLVTDTILSIPDQPPAVVQLNPAPLLFHARDHVHDVVDDTPANRTKGWKRIALFSCFFRPSAAATVPLGRAIREASQASDRSRANYFGLFPFSWKPDWERSFKALRCDGRLLVAPVLQTLILNRAPQETLAWANDVSCWDFERIIPCHLDAPLAADGRQFLEAFSFLNPEIQTSASDRDWAALKDDFEVLDSLDQGLTQRGITPPAKTP